MNFRFPLAAAAALAVALIAPVAAQATCNLKTIDVPLTMEGQRAILTAKINGHPTRLMLDSGAFYNSLSARFVADQKLRPAGAPVLGSRFREAASTVISGVGGRDTEAGIVNIPSFEFVGAKFSNIPFIALGRLGQDSDGILGQNFLHQLDDEYDLKNNMLRLVQPQDCAGVALAYWAAAAGQTYSAAPLETTSGLRNQTVAIITINGERMRATFDTGSDTSFITIRAAARAGVRTTDSGVTAAGYSSGIDRDRIKTWVGRFGSIKIGDEEIKNGLLAIGETDASDFDVLIGADFFLAHHVYVANSQRTLYFTYNGGPVFNVQAAQAAAMSSPAHAPQ
jgi:predicted aspartyl protease